MEMGVDPALRKRIKENVYLVVVEGFQLLSEWTGRVWQQSAWKFSRPAKDSERFDAERVVEVTDYEKVFIYSSSPKGGKMYAHVHFQIGIKFFSIQILYQKT